MTYEPSRSVEHLPPPPEQAQEGISWFAVLGTGSAALLIFTIATFVVYGYLQNREKALQPEGPDPIPMILGQPEIGIVDQVLFETDHRAEQWLAARRRRLHSWGWVDRRREIVHLPIEVAMARLLEEGRR
jgi:hypothetical protein